MKKKIEKIFDIFFIAYEKKSYLADSPSIGKDDKN